ncbi:PadR family transcriptional regulator [Kamptonema animale CS-326]|jgi:DNA-binding PadR family transcriptional regulator|uniref:PadR family transcriptional regulator n=1 Tax=Kamptonema TaxID=1501433 RepID=UPI0001DAC907|nr:MULTISPECIES: PadR family transcriptional regulator [Kamptonema]MDB9513998.1 PadR family transcriptional regulator [Kamptonema animale CS-326]CBN53857.1 PadR family transcriptional regulator [Kamptonema sp. PCC 6506]
MKFENIYQFFQDPPPVYLNKELAVCYILSVLLHGDSYGTELIGQLEREFPIYRLSDTVLYSALKFLEDEGVIAGYWKKVEGRGRPRRMYQIFPEWRHQSQDLARLWHEYTGQGNGLSQHRHRNLESGQMG